MKKKKKLKQKKLKLSEEKKLWLITTLNLIANSRIRFEKKNQNEVFGGEFKLNLDFYIDLKLYFQEMFSLTKSNKNKLNTVNRKSCHLRCTVAICRKNRTF
jgi:hypothetical protein